MRRVVTKEDWTLVDPYEVKTKLGFDLAELWGEKFDLAFQKIEASLALNNQNSHDTLKLYKKVNARELFKEIMRSQVETGMPYLAFKDTINRENPNKHEGYIPGVNLCVAPETKILTDKGQFPIIDLVDQWVKVWNGFEWSQVQVKQTGINQPLLKVNLSNGESLECTYYHHFWIKKTYRSQPIKVEAKDLNVGDKLIKYELPLISNDSDVDFPYAYTSGCFSGDGSYSGENHPELDLYGEKKNLVDFIAIRNKLWGGKNQTKVLDEIAIYHDLKQDRIVCKLPLDLPKKYSVPINGYTVQSRLEWLAGLLDTDGTVYCNGDNEGFAIVSIHKQFLLDIRLMLQTLGVDSKVTLMSNEGLKLMPNGKDGQKEYFCQKTYRLLINSNGVFQLAKLGLKTNRLKWKIKKPQRKATQFIQVTSVELTCRRDDTYCFTEPKRNLGMFNGILTGQCCESWSNVSPGKEAHTCNLDSLNLANIEDSELKEACDIAVRILDNTIEITKTPFKDSATHNHKYRTIGVGAMGLADWLAKRKLSYRHLREIDQLFENIGYYCTNASMKLSQERGYYPAFNGSEWSKGHLIGAKPLQWFLDNGHNPQRWQKLSEDIKKYGIRNSHITAIAPNTSSSLVQGCSASVLPVYSRFFYDKWAKGTVPIAPPFINTAFWYYQENKTLDQKVVVEAVATIQKWIDTGISMELIFNLNQGIYFPDQSDRAIKAKDILETLLLAWEKGCKAVYYIRTVQKDDFKELNEACASCAN